MTKKNVSKNTKLSYKRNKRNKRNTHRNMRRCRYTRLKKYNIKTHGGANIFFPNTEPSPTPVSVPSISNTSTTLTHVWYRNWPDHGVPTDIDEFRGFIDRLYDDIYNNTNLFKLEKDDAIIIHCSAGVGRSGVLLIILQLKKLQAEKDDTIITDQDILYAIIKARTYRMSLVQTFEQFMFICNFFNIETNLKNIQNQGLSFEPKDYITNTQTLASLASLESPTSLEAQTTLISNKTLLYKTKNRYSDILPYNKNRVKLQNVDNDYINASYMDTLTINSKIIKLILAQGPTPATVQDFLQMCVEQKVRLIIMLTGLKDADNTYKCADYMVSTGNLSLSNIDATYNNKKDVLYTNYIVNIMTQFAFSGTNTRKQEPILPQTTQQKSTEYHKTIQSLSRIDEATRLKVIEYLNQQTSHEENYNVEIDKEDFSEFFMLQNNNEKKNLKLAIQYGRQATLKMLKGTYTEEDKTQYLAQFKITPDTNNKKRKQDIQRKQLEYIISCLSKIDNKIKDKVIVKLTAMIQTQRNYNKEKEKKHQTEHNKDIQEFCNYIEELYTMISTEYNTTLIDAFKNYTAQELIDMLSAADAIL